MSAGIGRMLSYKEASSVFAYDPNTGALTWRQAHGRHKAGDPATRVRNGYRVVFYEGYVIAATRLAYLLQRQVLPPKTTQMRFRDGDTDNLRWSNFNIVS